jgi:LysM repeat protein
MNDVVSDRVSRPGQTEREPGTDDRAEAKEHPMSTLTIPAALPRPTRRPTAPRPVAVAPVLQERPAAVRLTRRGRALLTVAALGAAMGILGVAQPQAFALGHSGVAASERVTVRPGETLWAIAQRTAPGVDPRETVARIQSMNDLDSSTVPAGSVLLVPSTR